MTLPLTCTPGTNPSRLASHRRVSLRSLGFSDLTTRVMNRYLVGGPGTSDPDGNDAPNVYETFLGGAAKTARTLRAAGQAPAMKYMADSWVLDVFRDCPTDYPSVGPPWDPTGLICPNASLSAAVTEAVKAGDIC